MQLLFENFLVEGSPEELTIFAKNYEADEIRLSGYEDHEEMYYCDMDINVIECGEDFSCATVILKNGEAYEVEHSYESFDAFRNEVYRMIRAAIQEGIPLIPIGDIMVDYNDIKVITL